MQTFAERLTHARALRELGRTELSLAAGLSRNAVYVLETDEDGGNPTIDTAEKLAKALDVDFAWLTTGEGTPPKPKTPNGKHKAA